MEKYKPADAVDANEQIVKWLKDYALSTKAKGFVIGISGGIDSAVTSALCAETGLKVLCIEMPIHQPKSHVARGREHIKQLKDRFLNVSATEAELTQVFDRFVGAVPVGRDSKTTELALANTRSRLRMTTLYYHAAINNLLVVGTGNKVEDFGVGFYTKYGDGGVDLSPIADLMKSEVYDLAKYLQVPQSIIDAAPADGLFGDDRSDADQIGANYDELEVAMWQSEQGKTADQLVGREKEVFEIYERLNKANQHKMNAIPVCIIQRD